MRQSSRERARASYVWLAAAVAAALALGLARPAKAQQRWEHHCARERKVENVIATANKLGLEGWEMAGVSYTMTRDYKYLACFKRPKPAPLPAPVKTDAKGQLVISCNPACLVTLNKIQIGAAPIKRKVPGGTYTLEAVQPGYAKQTMKVVIEPGQTTTLMLDMKK